jgi:hypothetical protein
MEDSIFGSCKFSKIYVESPGSVPNTFVDMNYILLYSQNGRHGGISLSTTDQNNLICNFVKSKNFGEKMKSIGDDAIVILLKQLLHETITVKNYYLPIKIDTFGDLQKELESNMLNQMPLDSIYLKVEMRKKSEIFPILTIKNVEISKGTWRNQLWLCTHSIIKSNSESCLTDIINKVLSSTRTRQEILYLASSAEKLRDSVKNANLEDIFLNSGFLEKFKAGIPKKVSDEKIDNKIYLVKNDKGSIDSDPFFHVNYVDDKSLNAGSNFNIINSQDSDIVQVESRTRDMANHFSNTINVLSITYDLNDLNIEENAIGLNQEQDQNKGKEPEDEINMTKLEIEKDIKLYKIMIKKIKGQLPASTMQINLDLNTWAAQAHIISSSCSTMKIVDNSIKKDPEGLKDGIYYLHHKYPLKVNYNQSQEELISKGEWRPIKSLSPEYISRRVYKYKWHASILDMVCYCCTFLL